jgi:hypothetical protein
MIKAGTHAVLAFERGSDATSGSPKVCGQQELPQRHPFLLPFYY